MITRILSTVFVALLTVVTLSSCGNTIRGMGRIRRMPLMQRRTPAAASTAPLAAKKTPPGSMAPSELRLAPFV